MRVITALLATALLAGCMDTTNGVSRLAPLVSTGDPEAPYGAAISQSQCEQMALREISPLLKNPATARYSFGTCGPRSESALGLPGLKGYSIDVRVEAQNDWGIYTDPLPFRVLLRDGEVVRRWRFDTRRGQMVAF